MDPFTIILSLALKNPNAIADLNKPGTVDAGELQSSLADFAMQTLTCYHKTARFRGVDVVGGRWSEQATFGAEKSAVIRINLQGVTGNHYTMAVAAMTRGHSYRTFVIHETTPVPYNKHCSLEQWTSTTASN